jgi:16S rRNA (uracil1498-N3)-methyltransferase
MTTESDRDEDFSATRLFVEAPLGDGVSIEATPLQANYLRNVLRLGDGDGIQIFNGRDGEWQANLAVSGKRGCRIVARQQLRPQTGGPDIEYLFAPLKRARLDYMVQKATEMGVARLRPIITRRTNAERVNLERMRSNAIEAAEQCGILRIPDVAAPERLDRALAEWNADRQLVFCDESAPIADPIAALAAAPDRPLALLIGPEGGFDPAERKALLALPHTIRLSLGPRIMRADTAAVAALALLNAVKGDWRHPPAR